METSLPTEKQNVFLARVIRKVDNAIQLMNHYLAESDVC